LTVFDDCLLRALSAGGPVAAIWGRTTGCVQAEERRQGFFPASEPALQEGTAMRGLVFPPWGAALNKA